MKYSIGWGPPIGVCKSEMGPQRPILTILDLFFFLQKVPVQMDSGDDFFWPSFSLFLGVRETFFWRLQHFSRIGVVISRIGVVLLVGYI